jgi:hypothetical protein
MSAAMNVFGVKLMGGLATQKNDTQKNDTQARISALWRAGEHYRTS